MSRGVRLIDKIPDINDIVFGFSKDDKKCEAYLLERSIYKKVKISYSNVLMLSELEGKMFALETYEDLQTISDLTAEETIVKLLGKSRFEYYYPEDIYLSKKEYEELIKKLHK